MNKLLERPSRSPKVFVPGMPQVNLLPPEVVEARGLKALKRKLLVLVVAVAALCVIGFGYGKMQGASASSELSDAEAKTTQLQAEVQKYAEVPATIAQLKKVEGSLAAAMATDVDWKKAVAQIAAVLPDTVSIDTYTVAGATPMEAAAGPADPLQSPSVGTISFTLRATEAADTAPWIDAMNSLPGFQDAWFSQATTSSDDGGDFFQIQGSVQFTQDRYTNRFAADAAEKG
ncbi:MAG: hypothetical protein AAGC49_01860 [Brevundimonas sp.]